jgi:hypothetical protein
MNEVVEGAIIGRWTVLAVDRSSRRATCLCDCGNVRQATFAALASGQSKSCGCAPLSSLEFKAFRGEERSRTRLPDWRPKR